MLLNRQEWNQIYSKEYELTLNESLGIALSKFSKFFKNPIAIIQLNKLSKNLIKIIIEYKMKEFDMDDKIEKADETQKKKLEKIKNAEVQSLKEEMQEIVSSINAIAREKGLSYLSKLMVSDAKIKALQQFRKKIQNSAEEEEIESIDDTINDLSREIKDISKKTQDELKRKEKQEKSNKEDDDEERLKPLKSEDEEEPLKPLDFLSKKDSKKGRDSKGRFIKRDKIKESYGEDYILFSELSVILESLENDEEILNENYPGYTKDVLNSLFGFLGFENTPASFLSIKGLLKKYEEKYYKYKIMELDYREDYAKTSDNVQKRTLKSEFTDKSFKLQKEVEVLEDKIRNAYSKSGLYRNAEYSINKARISATERAIKDLDKDSVAVKYANKEMSSYEKKNTKISSGIEEIISKSNISRKSFAEMEDLENQIKDINDQIRSIKTSKPKGYSKTLKDLRKTRESLKSELLDALKTYQNTKQFVLDLYEEDKKETEHNIEEYDKIGDDEGVKSEQAKLNFIESQIDSVKSEISSISKKIDNISKSTTVTEAYLESGAKKILDKIQSIDLKRRKETDKKKKADYTQEIIDLINKFKAISEEVLADEYILETMGIPSEIVKKYPTASDIVSVLGSKEFEDFYQNEFVDFMEGDLDQESQIIKMLVKIESFFKEIIK